MSTGANHAQVIAQLIDDLRNNDSQIRSNAFRNISVIAHALGTERTREEFVPYLNEFIDDDDDILRVLAEELGGLIELIGGPQYAHGLLEPLETLAGVEENDVREKAVESLVKIINVMSEDQLHKFILPLLKQLVHGDWFTSRISACGLFSSIYNKVQDVKVQEHVRKELRDLFFQLCADQTPMVRRAACGKLGAFVNVVEPQFALSAFLPIMAKLSRDDQDSVRLLSVDACVSQAKALRGIETSADDSDKAAKLLLPVAMQLCVDKSWRVRYMVADKFVDLAAAVTVKAGGKLDDQIVDAYAKLLQDAESEVRTAAAFKVGDVAALVGPDATMKKLLGPMKQLVQDQCQFTRAALGREIMGLANVVSKKDVFDHLLPIFLLLLKDGNADVRLNLISKLETINQVVGVDLLSLSLLPAICELAMDKKWRVRLAIIKQIPQLSKQLGVEFFEQKLSDLTMSWMGDQVYDVREEATANLTRLAGVFGKEWALKHIVPKVLALCSHRSYVYRMTSLLAIRDLAAVLHAEDTVKVLLPAVITLASDRVANVRFTVAKTLLAISAYVPSDAVTQIVAPCLGKLVIDSDSDVQYYSVTAQEQLNGAGKK